MNEPVGQFGLSPDQARLAWQLAFHAADGAWASDSRTVALSRALRSGEMTAQTEKLALLTELLRLAAEDGDHAWEAPILTGATPEFVSQAYAAIKSFEVAKLGGGEA